MRRLVLILSGFLVVLQSGLGQVKDNSELRILFRGLIMDASNFSPIPNSQIMINKRFSSLSGKDGTFSFFVNKRDTVTFSSLGYVPSSMMISDSLSGEEFVAGIFMNSDTVQIGEVVIVPGYRNLRSDIFNKKSTESAYESNAKYNVALSAYSGKTTQGTLGNPIDNYAVISQRQKTDAFEKGGIPSNNMVSVSPFMLIPAAYLLIRGLPEPPAPFSPGLTQKEIDQIHEIYLQRKGIVR